MLKGISLAARDGDVISIIGASGSGKSTFLRCLNLLEAPDAGEIRLAGETIRLKHKRGLGLVAADPRQIDPDAGADRLRLPELQPVVAPDHPRQCHRGADPRRRRARAPRPIERGEALLAKVGIADKRHAYPAQLSGGQQQRAAIARALAMEPRVMLFDEPTSALDPELVGEVLQVMRELADEGRTMLVVTHEMRFARDASTQVVFLHEGLVHEQGPPSRVFQAPASERCRQFLASHL